jgi:methylphosphotriester-DNA--protein-cysteine methyltransferase
VSAVKTHCKNGHLFDEANTLVVNADRGWRACRRCHADKQRERRLAEGRPVGEKTHCKHGHLFDEANTKLRDAERGWRTCRRCKADQKRKQRIPAGVSS